MGFYICMVLGGIFLLLGLVFALAGEKATCLLSGFNFLSKEERAQYDRKRMASDYRNMFFLWGCIMLLGGAGCWLISGYIAVGACALWLVLFFRGVHLDTEKAYGKYRIEDEGFRESGKVERRDE